MALELETFFESLTRHVYEDIRNNFFEKMPQTILRMPYRCPKCGHEDVKIFKGLKDFF